MIFHNDTAHTVIFEVSQLHYEVPGGSECDIPPHLAYVVAARGLWLKPGPHPSGGERVEATVVTPSPKPQLPPGVATGPESEDRDDDSEPVDQVDTVIGKLAASGALPVAPKKGKR